MALPNPTVNSSVLAYDQSQTNEINRLIDVFYPVGTLYESVNAANPSTFMGGTWESFGAGQVTVAIDPSQAEFNAVNKTGGAKTHTLTVEEMPKHRHASYDGSNFLVGQTAVGGGTGAYASTYAYPDTAYAGGGQSHNNLQPFIVVYRFRRTA